jgi:hypothetical protein
VSRLAPRFDPSAVPRRNLVTQGSFFLALTFTVSIELSMKNVELITPVTTKYREVQSVDALQLVLKQVLLERLYYCHGTGLSFSISVRTNGSSDFFRPRDVVSRGRLSSHVSRQRAGPHLVDARDHRGHRGGRHSAPTRARLFEPSDPRQERLLSIKLYHLVKWLDLQGAALPAMGTLLIDESHDLPDPWYSLPQCYPGGWLAMGDPYQRITGRASQAPRAKSLVMTQSVRAGVRVEPMIRRTMGMHDGSSIEGEFRGSRNRATRHHASVGIPGNDLIFRNGFQLGSAIGAPSGIDSGENSAVTPEGGDGSMNYAYDSNGMRYAKRSLAALPRATARAATRRSSAAASSTAMNLAPSSSLAAVPPIPSAPCCATG